MHVVCMDEWMDGWSIFAVVPISNETQVADISSRKSLKTKHVNTDVFFFYHRHLLQAAGKHRCYYTNINTGPVV